MTKKQHKTPISIITGYLGTGKTTLLRHILANTDKKIAILMNEFGDIAIDSKVIKGKDINIAELAGGCVCCSLTGEFELAVREILKKVKPDWIIVETTGVAEPTALSLDIQENLPEIKIDAVITLVDCDSLIKFPSIGHTGMEQIEMGDIILLNKTDLVNEKQIKEIENGIRELNQMAIIHRTVKSVVDLDMIFGVDIGVELKEHKKHKEHKLDVEHFIYQSNKTFNKERFEDFAYELDKKVYRAKGFVVCRDATYLFNYVAGKFDLEEHSAKTTELVFIGEGVSRIRSRVTEQLEKCAN